MFHTGGEPAGGSCPPPVTARLANHKPLSLATSKATLLQKNDALRLTATLGIFQDQGGTVGSRYRGDAVRSRHACNANEIISKCKAERKGEKKESTGFAFLWYLLSPTCFLSFKPDSRTKLAPCTHSFRFLLSLPLFVFVYFFPFHASVVVATASTATSWVLVHWTHRGQFVHCLPDMCMTVHPLVNTSVGIGSATVSGAVESGHISVARLHMTMGQKRPSRIVL